jgi:hypothetical protein
MIAMQPYDDQGKPRKDFDKDMFFDAAKLLRDCAGMVAQYESPKLSAIAIAPPARKEVTRMTIRIFDDKGNKVEERIDGVRQPLQIEGGDHHNGPLRRGD